MVGHYKDVREVYAYTIPLTSMGYKHFETFADGSAGSPPDFHWTDKDIQSGWTWRRKIKEYVKERQDIYGRFKDVRIVKANGYWRDLNRYTYEVWVKES